MTDVNPKTYAWFPEEGTAIYADLDDQGVVTFAVEAREGSQVRGTELFNRMMQFFGEEVRAIEGMWIKGSQGRRSTNIDKVNELTATGVPLEEAIQQAWTVTRAQKLGFGRVRILRLEGQPGLYTKINVLIEK